MNATFTSSVLILEDEPLIAMDVEDAVEKIGFQSITSLTRCEDAEVWLAHNKPTLAVIDIELKDGPCIAVAEALDHKGIPFLVVSGKDIWDVHSVFRKGAWLPKPCSRERLVKAVCNAVPEVCA